jgi:hypothetical protein
VSELDLTDAMLDRGARAMYGAEAIALLVELDEDWLIEKRYEIRKIVTAVLCVDEDELIEELRAQADAAAAEREILAHAIRSFLTSQAPEAPGSARAMERLVGALEACGLPRFLVRPDDGT